MAPPPLGLSIALLGAECTGKTALAHALVHRLRQHGLRAHGVDEWLRHWCEQQARTPRQDEQSAIADEQQRRIDAARAGHDITVCDTTPLMTAVYSQHYFADDSLLAAAVARQRGHTLTLLLTPDLPWMADGLQRDGETTRAAVHQRLLGLLPRERLSWVTVSGTGPAREAQAWAAVQQACGLAHTASAEPPPARAPDPAQRFS